MKEIKSPETTNPVFQKAKQWLNSSIDQNSKDQILELLKEENKNELEDAFYKDLEFGTGGLRGLMGVGTNRMNIYTVGAATQGLSNYLIKAYPNKEIKVAIAHDSRNNSSLFAETAASVFSANGIKVFFFKHMRPTPELSFAVRYFNCQAGVVVTASHNPKEYNGYKVYGNDGAQIVSPEDKLIIGEVNQINGIEEINFERNEDLIQRIGEEVDNLYLEAISKISISPQAIANQKGLKIVFSPIHGTGITLVPKILDKLGFDKVTVVEQQAKGDGNFPTVKYPNPEEKEALSMALSLGKEIDADLIMATDPDADRVGIAVKNHHGDFQLLNGNQTGALIIYYLLKKWKEEDKLNGKQYIAKTIVTSNLLDTIATHFQVECINTLTGFKYIAEVIRKFDGQKEFIGGGEESYGYLIGDFVRDKDAVASCAIIAEIAAFAKDNGFTLFDMLLDVYKNFGIYQEQL
ncbi:phospho-sugar mutase, partial [Xanthovirga aplysinae]|uniref:phospho-sugar mutase n=1 Tax=Xanthovirga aplysinae TaxID=2529853 RepID=UPI0012BC11C0